MSERLSSIFDKKDLFYLKQNGFRSERSTIDTFAETEKISQGSIHTFTCILLDLRSAFDSVNHEKLLKLRKCAVR